MYVCIVIVVCIYIYIYIYTHIYTYCIGTFTFTGWSFIGNHLSKCIQIVKVCSKQIHTNKAQIIGESQLFKQMHTKKAPTNKGQRPYE